MIRLNFEFPELDQNLRMLFVWQGQFQRVVERAVERNAMRLSSQIKNGIRSQAPGGQRFKPLAPSTADAKGSSKALMDNLDLLKSIKVTKVRRFRSNAFFVGVYRRARGKAGQKLANVAEIHETGSKKVKDRPPQRAFLKPSYDEWARYANMQFAIDVATAFNLQGSVEEVGGSG